jgi:hypothetical protein
MYGDLINTWDPAAAYLEWLLAARLAVRAELGLARMRVQGRSRSMSEVTQAKSLRAAADALWVAAQAALPYIHVDAAPRQRSPTHSFLSR